MMVNEARPVDIGRILRFALSGYVRAGAGVVTTLLLTPILLQHLGPDGYGLWVLTLSVQSYFGLADLGIANSATRFLAQAYAVKDWGRMNRTLSVMGVLYLSISLIVVGVTAALVVFGPTLFHTRAAPLVLRLLLLNLGAITLLGFVAVLPIQCVIAAQRLDILNAWLFGVQLSVVLATWVGLVNGGGILLLAALQLSSAIATLGIGLALARNYLPSLRFRLGWYKSDGRSLLSLTTFALIAAVATRVIYASDAIVISSVISVAAVVPFALALKAIQGMQISVASANAGLGAVASEQYALGRRDGLRSLWSGSTRWALFVVLPLGALFLADGKALFEFWLGSGYALSATVLAWLTIGHVADLSQNGTQLVLLGSGHHRFVAAVSTVEAAVNLTLSLLLIRPFGIVGVAIGTTLPLLLRSGLALPIYTSRVLGYPLSDYFRDPVVPSLAAATAPIAVVLFGHLYFPTTSLLALGVTCSTAAGTAVASGWVFALTETEKASVRRLVRSATLALTRSTGPDGSR